MTTTIVLATRNAKKLAEMDRILRAAGLDVHVAGVDEVAPGMPDVPETEPTFAGNALLKARAAARHSGLIAVSDDSGLCVDELNGMPGVLSARWAGSAKDDAANLALLLDQLADTPAERRGASFRCAMALVTPDGHEVTVEGSVAGHLVREPRGTGGFGYDPVFVPDGQERTTAELPPAEKDALSHRGRAIALLVPHLQAVLGR